MSRLWLCGDIHGEIDFGKRLMGEYDGVFELVGFSVYCPPRDSSNYDVFARVLRGM